MKKSLIALAVLAAAGSASAQSSVTLFGIVDATLMWGHGSVSNKHQLGNSGYNSSRLGFRGTEDLGGGMSASFWLEASVNNDNGTGAGTNTNNQASGNALAGLAGGQGLTFNRRSTVSLAGGWGELRLGRDYTPQFWNITVFDPFGTNGVGTTQVLNSIITGVTAVRSSNGVGYFLPANLGGFYGQLQYYMGENNSNVANKDDGNGYGVRLGFASGPFNVAAAFSHTDYSTGNVSQNNVGGQWDFGVAKLMGEYEWDKAGATKGRGGLIGGLIPVGPGEIRLAISRYKTDVPVGTDPRTNKWALGYVHNMSKRTALYATYAHVSNKDGAASSLNGAVTGINNSSSGLDLGIRHSF
ncbi:MAG TPA: porin [Ramlibacter sp.]|uniref:porin n=1 Tax=Ramlibacter sp. TaxID=1917967 RepID=UPI002C7CD893|nr:porin [Ramlibacter sp.]HVZ44282.1 porin [Ramlibacter sp.]